MSSYLEEKIIKSIRSDNPHNELQRQKKKLRATSPASMIRRTFEYPRIKKKNGQRGTEAVCSQCEGSVFEMDFYPADPPKTYWARLLSAGRET